MRGPSTRGSSSRSGCCAGSARWSARSEDRYRLQAVPDEPYEAAKVDGANWFQAFRHVTFPLLTPAILIAVLLRFMDTLRIFDQVFVMTQGGPANATETISLYIYQTAFAFTNVGYATAMSFVLLVVTTLIGNFFVVGQHAVDVVAVLVLRGRGHVARAAHEELALAVAGRRHARCRGPAAGHRGPHTARTARRRGPLSAAAAATTDQHARPVAHRRPGRRGDRAGRCRGRSAAPDLDASGTS